MRLAICGTSGIGKTTLAIHLAERLSLPLLPEDLNRLVRIAAALRDARHDPVRRSALEQVWHHEANRWLQQRRHAQRETPEFVADRCCFDILSRCLLADLAHQRPQTLNGLLEECHRQSADLDLIVVPPLMTWALQESRNEVGLLRDSDPARKLLSHSLIIGLLQQHSLAPVLVLPPGCSSTEERAQRVLDWRDAFDQTSRERINDTGSDRSSDTAAATSERPLTDREPTDRHPADCSIPDCATLDH